MGFETKQFEEYREDDKPKKKEQPKEKKVDQKDTQPPIDQQKFIENKFTRLDSVFKKEQSKVTSEKSPSAPSVLDTKRGTITFHIEKERGFSKNAEVVVKDGKDTIKILIEYPEESLQYRMSVLKNGVAQNIVNANAVATKYIGML